MDDNTTPHLRDLLTVAKNVINDYAKYAREIETRNRELEQRAKEHEQAIKAAVNAEREACAQLCDGNIIKGGEVFAGAIRDRGKL